MIDIPQYSSFTKIELINKGWSSDKKYYIENGDGQKLLLRISDISEYNRKKAEYEAIVQISALGINMSAPLDFGVCNNNKEVYTLFTWIEGEDAEIILPSLSTQKQYELGLESGRLLRKMHSIPAPHHQEPWKERFNRKIDRKLTEYQKCGYTVINDEKIIQYINDNRHLLDNREQSIHHGDYHVGNLVVTPNLEIGIIDFNRYDYGDPWEEFNRIVWSVNVSYEFSNGQIHGYFDGDIPEEFFKLMAFYIASNAISSIPWAISYGEAEVATMLKNIQDMLDYYKNFSTHIPTWYRRCEK